jgi:hypothetical protein
VGERTNFYLSFSLVFIKIYDSRKRMEEITAELKY